MNSLFNYHSYSPDIASIQDVIDQMQAINTEIQNTNLNHLQAFNTTYLIITKNVQKKLNSNYFNNDLLMEQFDVHFAKYYFLALYSFVQTGKTTPAWSELFNCGKWYPHIMYMALGVNAHVNNDLGLSLYDIVEHDHEYKEDFEKINTIICNSIDEVIYSLSQRNNISITLQNISKPIVYMFLSQLIKRWRGSAWDTYISLQKAQRTVKQVETLAHKKAKRLKSGLILNAI